MDMILSTSHFDHKANEAVSTGYDRVPETASSSISGPGCSSDRAIQRIY
ncbi:MAG: hypothetical protein HGB36_13050 [Chlorobiaceae bacterium]|nr:hypothetical protein [Chlorobiaceae bacterium]